MLEIWKSNYKKFDEVNGQVRKEIDKLEQERQKIFDLHRTSAYTDEEFVEQKKIVNQKIFEKSQFLHDNRIEEFNMEEALDYCFSFVREVAKTWARLTYPNNARFQKMVFPEKIGFDGKKFGNTKLATVFKLKQDYDGKKSDLVPPLRIELRSTA